MVQLEQAQRAQAAKGGRQSFRPKVALVAIPFAVVLIVAIAAVASAEANEFELLGAWHVTTHYRDSASENPEVERWDDRVWRFERRGSRLQWTEFPIVVFRDRRGRFEPGGGERTMRVLQAWEPNEAQAKEIVRGVLVNPRGARSKGLRGNPAEGYASLGGLRAESASVIGYSESWRIGRLLAKPVFTRDDILGSAHTENIRGRTQYVTESVQSDGNELRGTFVRDGTRRGGFVMRRAGELFVMGSKQARRREADAAEEEKENGTR